MAMSLRSQSALSCKAQTQRGAKLSVLPTRNVSRVTIQQRRVAPQATSGDSDPQVTSVDSDKVLKDLQAKWEKIDNKPQVALYVGGGVFALWLTSTVIGAINHVPVLPKLFELVGLGYSAWFTYRYLLFKASREELIKDVEELKGKITGGP